MRRCVQNRPCRAASRTRTMPAKNTKASTKASVAPTAKAPTAKAPTAKGKPEPKASPVPKIPVLRLKEEDKAADPDTYVMNPATGKYVKRDSPTGKKILKAEEEGTELEKPMTETERLLKFVEILRDECDLSDDQIAAALGKSEYEDLLPRAWPALLGRQAKEKRTPEAPKRPPSSFFCYQSANREALAKVNKGMSSQDLVEAPRPKCGMSSLTRTRSSTRRWRPRSARSIRKRWLRTRPRILTRRASRPRQPTVLRSRPRPLLSACGARTTVSEWLRRTPTHRRTRDHEAARRAVGPDPRRQGGSVGVRRVPSQGGRRERGLCGAPG